MYIYIFVFFAISFLALVDLNILRSKSLKYISITFISIILFIFAGLRFEVGTDYFGYKDIFDRLQVGELVNVEPGYIFLIKSFQCISSSYTLFVIILFLLSYLIKLSFFLKTTPYVSFTLLIYFSSILVSTDINQLRMGLSFAIIFFSIHHIVKRNILFFYITVILASTIHYSAVIFLPAYFIANINFSLKGYLIILVFAIFNFYYLKYFLIDNFSLDILFFLNEDYQNKYSVYNNAENEFDSIYTIVSRIILFFVFVYFNCKRGNLITAKLLNLYFFSIIIYLVLSRQGLIVSRLSGYYKLTEIILLPFFLDLFKDYKIKLFVFCCLVFYLFIAFFRLLLVPGDLFPYKNLLF